MFKKLKLPFNLSIIEGISIIGFIAIGFCIIYKAAYYNTLGIPWLINSLNPQLIIISSIRFLFFLTISSFFGWIIIQFLSSKKNGPEIFFLTFICIFAFILFIKFLTHNKIPIDIIKNLPINTSAIFTSFVSLFIGAFLSLSYHNNKYANNTSLDIKTKKYFSFYYSILAIGTITIFPYFIGVFDAISIKGDQEKQNFVVLKDSNEEWFIVELIGEKVILINNTLDKTKIVELKEIKHIKNLRT
ncbi:hypothetical protein QZK53_07255 [Acinetobacter baumannii]|uniref:hypothetical protein n=1 Tax=Acinetobacter baumannii TaxID=470 RepID=UPI001EEFCE21|nr:hypothetical protein [Acinetobacter baumannii]MCG6604131.1 hypothetical protein [Acinetobacter baumannii]MDN8366551.1 hypothetical protein [Acinetobacter baumannii]